MLQVGSELRHDLTIPMLMGSLRLAEVHLRWDTTIVTHNMDDECRRKNFPQVIDKLKTVSGVHNYSDTQGLLSNQQNIRSSFPWQNS